MDGVPPGDVTGCSPSVIVPCHGRSATWCYDFEQCICDKPVLAFGTERITIVNSRRLSSQRSQRSDLIEFGELHKECLLRKRYCLSEFESEVYQSRLTKF
jgi:hypothetical protein